MSAEPGRKTAYSVDIRWRVIWQRYGMELSFRRISANLSISTGTVHNVLKRFEETGDVAARGQKERPDVRRLTSTEELFIVGLVLESPALQLQEVCKAVQELSGVGVSPSTVCRLLKKHGFTRKKMRYVALQRSSQFRADFMAEILQYRRDQLVWVDETGCDRKDGMRKYGYAIRGKTPQLHRFLARGQRISAITALTKDGILATELRTGTTDSDKFYDFLRGSVIPNMHPYDGVAPKSILIMDNCSIHHVQDVLDLLQSCGILVVFLPPYSPDFTPIESAFSFVKQYLKKHDEVLQAMTNPIPLIQSAFDSITPILASSWVTDCGYSY